MHSFATTQMRLLSKEPVPTILVDEGDRLRAEYEAAQSSGSDLPMPWRHPDIVSALERETLSKCAYCEAIIADVSYPHVEHILPKAARPDLVVDWNNLTLACPACNTNKGDYYRADAPLVHPYEDPVTKHILFRGPAVFAPLESEIGERTIQRLRLMRAPLLMERMKRIDAVYQRLIRWNDANEPDKSVLAELVKDAVDDAAEFAQCLRTFVSSLGFPL
ncbi:MAG TPA: HNH endonuclease [Actinomycetota bacterium]|nr:HNH endonuclease [Actinomycetota bacterium]